MTGAGFTRAFVPDAPLLVDDFGNDALVEKVRGLPAASRLLEAERNRHRDGYIDIERLMSRLDELMPYDYADGVTDEYEGVVDEYDFLLIQLKRAFVRRIVRATAGVTVEADLVTFGHYCAEAGATCMTFNYDQYLDEALYASRRWNPSWGYGFFCRPAADAVSRDSPEHDQLSEFLLLKLHGSVNWRPRLGYSDPVALDAIVHHDAMSLISHRLHPRDVVARHLEPEPVIVPPVLSKSGLGSQPALRIVWKQAFERLSAAGAVTFIGYSFPPTDIAAQVLFAEALGDLPPADIRVVGLKADEQGQQTLKSRYRDVFGEIPDSCFFFDGAADWLRSLVSSQEKRDRRSRPS